MKRRPVFSPAAAVRRAALGTGTAGSVLVGLLWCVALLSVIVIGVLHTSRMDLVVAKNYSDQVQAHYLAVAGLEKAKALLYQDARERTRTARNHSGDLYNAPAQFRDVPFGRGEFRVFRRGRPDEGGGLIYGVSDEESRLNVNTAELDDLGKLDGMTPDVAAAIIDWRDPDNTVTPGGAEAEYYLSLRPPYLPRNGPLQTVRELLGVRGVTRNRLLGHDRHQNGLLPASGEGDEVAVSDASDLGWAGVLTVDSRVANVNAAGEERVNVQSADESSLTRVRGITPDIAKAIVASRGRNRLESLADLLDVTAANNQDNPGGPGANPNGGAPNPANLGPAPNPGGGPGPGNAAPNASGPPVISQDLLMDIADDITVTSGNELTGVVNLNTASLPVLICLPGVSRELAQAIIAYRQANGFFPNTAHLLRVSGMTRDLFKQLEPRVSARSETFRILCEGKIKSTGARCRVQEIVHVGLRSLTTLSYREDDL